MFFLHVMLNDIYLDTLCINQREFCYVFVAPGSPPLHFGGVALNSTSIHLTWDQPHPTQQNGIIQFYLINLTELESGMQSQYTINQTQITIYNLYPFYTYTVTVAAVTVSMGPHTEIVTVTTHQECEFYLTCITKKHMKDGSV